MIAYSTSQKTRKGGWSVGEDKRVCWSQKKDLMKLSLRKSISKRCNLKTELSRGCTAHGTMKESVLVFVSVCPLCQVIYISIFTLWTFQRTWSQDPHENSEQLSVPHRSLRKNLGNGFWLHLTLGLTEKLQIFFACVFSGCHFRTLYL